MDTVEAVNTHCKKVNKFSYGDMPQGAQTISYLDDDEKGVTTNYTPGGEQEMLISGYPYALRKIQRFQGR